MTKLVIAGTILVDAIKTIPLYPEVGKLVQISSVSHSVGGAVPNTAIDIAKLDKDFSVTVFGKIGKDDYGTFVKCEMEKAGLDVSHLLVSESAPTSFTDAMSILGGERTFFTLPGANAELDVDDFDFDALAPSHLHLGYLLLLDTLDRADTEYGSRAARLLAKAKERGITTSIDLISEPSDRYKSVVAPVLPYVDYLIVNEVEAAKIANIPLKDGSVDKKTLQDISTRILDMGVQKKVILHCPMLGSCLDRSGKFTAVPSLDLPKGYIVGATGAGDAFCAGALYGLLHGYTDEEILSLGSLCAAANLSCADSVSGMRPLNELFALEKLYKRKTNIC